MDTSGAGPPDPGGQPSQHGGQSSKHLPSPPLNARSQEMSVQKQPVRQSMSGYQKPSSSALQSLSSVQNKTSPASGGASRQSQTGKQEKSSAFDVESITAALPKETKGSYKEKKAQLEQMWRDQQAAQAASKVSSGDKRAAPEPEHNTEDEGRLTKRPQTAAPVTGFPFTDIQPFHPTRCIIRVESAVEMKPLFGSLGTIPGVTIKAAVHAGRMGDPSFVISMAINEDDMTTPISGKRDEVSRFDLVWEPCVLTKIGYRVHSFDYCSLEDHPEALGEAREDIMSVTKGNLKKLVRVDLRVNDCRMSNRYRPEFWTRLRKSTLAAHKRIHYQ